MTLFRFAHIFSRPAFARSLVSTQAQVLRSSRLAFATVFAVTAYLAYKPQRVHLDSHAQQTSSFVKEGAEQEDTIVDPATSIAFPKTMHIPSHIDIPPLSLVGIGVRTVSFLGIKVYSVGFYADLNNPNLKVPLDTLPEEKIQHIIRNTCCVIRIVPVRSTSFNHLRDAFIRALQSRLSTAIKEGSITEEVVAATSSDLRKLKGLFPNSTLAKHTPLDVFLSAPLTNRQRVLVFRDLGSVESDWVATEFVLHYFDKPGPSPHLKTSVFEHLKSYSR